MATNKIKKILLNKDGDNFVADIENIENRISQNSSELSLAKQELSDEVKNVDNQLSKLTYNIKYGNKSFRSALIFYAYPTDINELYEVDLVVPVIGQYDLAVFGRDLCEPTCEARPDTIKIISQLNNSYGTEVFGYVPIGCLTPEEDPEIDISNLTIDEIKTRVLSWKEMGAKGIFLDEFGYDYRTTRERQNEIVDFCHENSLQVIANAWVLDHVFGTENYIVEAGNTAQHPGNPNKLECHLTENDYIFFEHLMFEATSTTNVKAVVPWDVYKVQEYYEKYYKKFKTQVFIANQIPSKASVDVQKELKRCSEIAGAAMQADVVAVSAEFWSSDTPKTFYAEPFEIDGVKSRFIDVTESKDTSGYPVKFKSVIGSKEYELVWNASEENDTVYSSTKNYAQINSNRNYPLNVSAEKLVYQDYEITAQHNFKNGINLNGVTLNGTADGSLTWNSKEISTKEYVDDLRKNINNTGSGSGQPSVSGSGQPSVSGTTTLNGSIDNTFVLDNIVPSLGLEVGDVIRIVSDEPVPESIVTAQEIDGSLKPYFRSPSVVDGDIYCTTHDTTVANGGGIWRQAGADGAFERVYESPLNYATPVVSDGTHYYFGSDAGKIKKVVNKDWDNVVDLTTTNRRFFGLVFNPKDGYLYACLWDGLIYKIDPETGTETSISTGNKSWSSITVDPETGIVYASFHLGGFYSSESDFNTQLFAGLSGGTHAQIQWVNNALGKGLLITRKGGEPAFVSMVDNPDYEITSIPTRGFTFDMLVSGIAANGDQIYVADSTGIYRQELKDYDKLHTVESITDDSNIIVNYEHAGNRGNGSLKLPDFTGQATVTRVAKWFNAPISLGQAWIETTGSRVSNVEYINDTGKPIFVFFYKGSGAGGFIYVDGNKAACIANSTSVPGSLGIPISPGSTYKFEFNVTYSFELR